MTTTRAPRSTASTTACENWPGASSAGSICCIVSRPSSIAALSSMPSWLQRFSILLRASSNRNMAQGSRRALAAYTNCGQRRLAGAGRAGDQGAHAFFEAAAEQRVESRDAARQLAPALVDARVGRHQARIDLQAAAHDLVVVGAAVEGDAAVFDDAQPAPFAAIGLVQHLQRDHAVRHAAHLQVGA